jgi:hypothetical protein
MGHSAGFCSALWAIMQYLIMCYGAYRRIWLCAVGCAAGFGYIYQINYQSADVHNSFFKSLPYPLKRL